MSYGQGSNREGLLSGAILCAVVGNTCLGFFSRSFACQILCLHSILKSLDVGQLGSEVYIGIVNPL